MLTDEEKLKLITAAFPVPIFDTLALENLIDMVERAVLAKAGEQEPLAHVFRRDAEYLREKICCVNAYHSPMNHRVEGETVPLYARPMPAQAIPEKMQYSDDDDGDSSHAYVNGYNDAIDVMLSASPKPNSGTAHE